MKDVKREIAEEMLRIGCLNTVALYDRLQDLLQPLNLSEEYYNQILATVIAIETQAVDDDRKLYNMAGAGNPDAKRLVATLEALNAVPRVQAG